MTVEITIKTPEHKVGKIEVINLSCDPILKMHKENLRQIVVVVPNTELTMRNGQHYQKKKKKGNIN